jgi:hypothetical protein
VDSSSPLVACSLAVVRVMVSLENFLDKRTNITLNFTVFFPAFTTTSPQVKEGNTEEKRWNNEARNH